MTRLVKHLKRFLADESGEDGIEYALLLAMITIMLCGAMAASGDQIRGMYNGLSNTWGTSLDDVETTAPATLD